jgi:hypothetical protein
VWRKLRKFIEPQNRTAELLSARHRAAAVKRPAPVSAIVRRHISFCHSGHASQLSGTSSGTTNPDVRAYTATMSDAVHASPSPRDSADEEQLHDPLRDSTTGAPEDPKAESGAPALDLKVLTDRTLHFLATASNETLGACLAGLGAGTYLILGRVGLVLIGVAGGVVLHATWEGHNGDNKETDGKSAEGRRRELGADIAHRVLDWRNIRTQEKDGRDHDSSELNVQLFSGKTLDYSDFKPETAAALTELTDAVIRDYVKYVLHITPSYLSNALQVVVFARDTLRRDVPQLVPPNPYCIHTLHICTPLPQATSR